MNFKNRFNPNYHTSGQNGQNGLPNLPPSPQIARQLPPRADPLEYEVSSWYGPERVERILLNTCVQRVSSILVWWPLVADFRFFHFTGEIFYTAVLFHGCLSCEHLMYPRRLVLDLISRNLQGFWVAVG